MSTLLVTARDGTIGTSAVPVQNRTTIVRAPGPAPQTVVVRVPGQQGAQGTQGDLGQGSAGAAYSQEFLVAAATWIVQHDLGAIPSVVLLDADGQEMDADVIHGSLNTLTVVHGAPTAGSVHLRL